MAGFDQPQPWRTFPQIVQQLHREGMDIHPDPLAEFFLAHGLPVGLQYVPPSPGQGNADSSKLPG